MMKFGMMACCVVMVLPIVFYLVAGGTLAGLTSNLAVWAPLLLCAGAHLLMFKLMGKSCHGSNRRAKWRNRKGPLSNDQLISRQLARGLEWR